MANRRMTSLDITDTDAFLDMPSTSQLLYFHLNQRADDDGFVANPKKIMKIANVGDDDMKVLVAKKFVIAFDDGVCVIKHWRINNFIRKDIYKETNYLNLKSTLFISPNGAYTLNEEGAIKVPEGHFNLENIGDSSVNATLTTRQHRIGKVRKGKDTDTFERFWTLFPKKVAKKKAELSWDKVPPEEHDLIYAHIQRQSLSEEWRKERGRFIPHPTTYLNQERWKDLVEIPKEKPAREMTQAEMRDSWQK